MRVHVLASGGLDSTTLAHHYKANGYEATLHWFDFGQPSAPIEWRTVRQLGLRLACQTASHTLNSVRFNPGEVPGRNESFVMETLPHVAQPALIALGIHAGCEYEDTQPAFRDRVQRVLDDRYDGLLRLDCPFITLSKTDIAHLAVKLGVDIPSTFSCDTGDPTHCGNCRSCKERIDALHQAGVSAIL